ncbi:BZIP-type transcription factor [Podospora fimiseda]|uniref:BZIP-type transcription factor n=1 Tax=Podospora fimiseda TaxID=252190 RepID=A0AAN7H7E6_9PEZI|nr:BZIP-type transcription factor [Podospora fimiseda]
MCHRAELFQDLAKNRECDLLTKPTISTCYNRLFPLPTAEPLFSPRQHLDRRASIIMASYSMSPDDSGYSGLENDPLSTMNADLIRSVEDKKAGLGPKKRGPKPDSKPALTRRQELNRKAQRTHRERKENYVRALEDELIRLKADYTSAARDKDRLAEENQQLKVLLSQVGLNQGVPVVCGGLNALDDSMSNPSIGYSSTASITGSFAPQSSNTSAFTPPPLSAQHTPVSGNDVAAAVASRNPALDYEQAGIDFVLTLERPCMDHLPWLLERGAASTGAHEPCGHALMASCPPQPFSELTDDILFGYSNIPKLDGGYPQPHVTDEQVALEPQRTWELSKANLATLLNLSKRLNLDGEVTPVMAWGMVLAHPRLSELKPQDFVELSKELRSKIRCYGFGAVMEEFEVRDALENVFSTLPEMVF